MTLDKSWTKITNKVDPKFIKGAIAFAERGETYIDSEGRIHCPCRKCVNARKHVPKVVGYHIMHNGFESSYNVWLHYSEHLPGYETDDTRRSHEPDSRQPRIQTVVNGSTSEVISHPTRKRIRRLADNEVTDPPTVDPPKRRGPSLNLGATKTLDNLPQGAKISLTLSGDTKGFVGNSATQFATECGITIRNYCPMNYHTWESVPDDVKNMLYEKLQGRFNLLRSDRVFMEHVNARLHAQWKRTRGTLSAYWKKNGGKTNLHLKYNDQMEANRGKQVITSRGGSRSISNHRFHLTNKETQQPPSPLEIYYKLHFNAKKQGWLNEDARIEYEKIFNHKKEVVAKLVYEGTTPTTNMVHELEKEAIKSVCAKEKTTKSAWQIGVGPVLKKTDFWMTSEAQSSQPHSNETETLRNQVASLKEELKQSNEIYEKISMFMSSKFPDFESLVYEQVNDEANGVNDEANGSNEQLNDSYDSI